MTTEYLKIRSRGSIFFEDNLPVTLEKIDIFCTGHNLDKIKHPLNLKIEYKKSYY